MYIHLITTFGPAIAYLLIFATIFAECGLLVGFFLPGDSLLFGLGILAATHTLALWPILIAAAIGAISGNIVGYLIGKKAGHSLFSGQHNWLFSQKHLHTAQAFYAKYGNATVILSRFVPIVRTFAPVVAGAAEMPYRPFVFYSVIGGLAWSVVVTILGYYLGQLFPNLDKYVTYVLVAVVLVSFISAARHFVSNSKKAN